MLLGGPLLHTTSHGQMAHPGAHFTRAVQVGRTSHSWCKPFAPPTILLGPSRTQMANLRDFTRALALVTDKMQLLVSRNVHDSSLPASTQAPRPPAAAATTAATASGAAAGPLASTGAAQQPAQWQQSREAASSGWHPVPAAAAEAHQSGAAAAQLQSAASAGISGLGQAGPGPGPGESALSGCGSAHDHHSPMGPTSAADDHEAGAAVGPAEQLAGGLGPYDLPPLSPGLDLPPLSPFPDDELAELLGMGALEAPGHAHSMGGPQPGQGADAGGMQGSAMPMPMPQGEPATGAQLAALLTGMPWGEQGPLAAPQPQAPSLQEHSSVQAAASQGSAQQVPQPQQGWQQQQPQDQQLQQQPMARAGSASSSGAGSTPVGAGSTPASLAMQTPVPPLTPVAPVEPAGVWGTTLPPPMPQTPDQSHVLDQHWAVVAQAMGLSAQQVNETSVLLELHQEWVARLHEERQRLSTQLDGLLSQQRYGQVYKEDGEALTGEGGVAWNKGGVGVWGGDGDYLRQGLGRCRCAG